jgi:SAM-dependent methyltransferase
VKAFWHPLATILLAEPRCFATEGLVRMLLATERRADLVYAGDRMWPALPYGASFRVEPPDRDTLSPGAAVLVSRAGIPDLLRVSGADRDRVALAVDADPDGSVVLSRDAVLGRARLPASVPGPRRASLRRLALDLREAWTGRPDPREDPIETVRDKYESQATYYARVEGVDLESGLLAHIRERVRTGGTVLVVGSGTGRECFALAEAGWRVVGVEFAPTMVTLAAGEASRRGLEIDFRRADVRRLGLPEGSLDGIIFTYGVYSFFPWSGERVALLRRMRSWLRPDGVVFLSAQVLGTAYERLIVTLQWLAQARRGDAEWGDSHTRWIPNDGKLYRSFLHVFSPARLRSETAAAGFRTDPWEGTHVVLTPRRLL